MSTKTKFKLNENVEFLEKDVRNWRYGKVKEVLKNNHYKIYSGLDVFTTRVVKDGAKEYLETI